MKPLKGSRTEANLMAAFAGETQARTKYTYYASQAKKTVMCRFQRFLKKPLPTKKNTQKSGSSCCTAVQCRQPQRI